MFVQLSAYESEGRKRTTPSIFGRPSRKRTCIALPVAGLRENAVPVALEAPKIPSMSYAHQVQNVLPSSSILYDRVLRSVRLSRSHARGHRDESALPDPARQVPIRRCREDTPSKMPG